MTVLQCTPVVQPRVCKRGHLVEGANVYVAPRGHKECRACRGMASARATGRDYVFDPSYVLPAERTHCPKGHPYSADNTIIHGTRGHRICKICRKESHRRAENKLREQRMAAGLPAHEWRPFSGASGRLTEDQVRTIAERLHAGETLNQITKNDPVCTDQTLRAFRHKNSRRWKPLGKLAEANRHRKWVETLRARRLVASPAVMQNNGATAFNAICAATAHLPDHLRDDVRSLMILAAAEGRLKPRDAVKRVREFVTAHNRQFSAFVPVIGGRMQSLDQQVYDDGPTRLIDTVTQGLWG